ncbi:MAG: hypothetical protein JXR70_19845 [Spirochaetales bacterium]|nr:hypothetical protein [Spirochaetales bacterium]
MKIDNNITLALQKYEMPQQAANPFQVEDSAVSKAVKQMMAENPVLMDTIEIKSILYLGIKGPINLESVEGQSIDTFA